jgi:hypothetical protein
MLWKTTGWARVASASAGQRRLDEIVFDAAQLEQSPA